MKRLIANLFLILMACSSAFGQWYQKTYHVNDINLLTKNQLEASLTDTRKQAFNAAGATALGGVLFLIFKYCNPENDNPTVIEDMIGNENMNKIWATLSAGLAVGGALCTIVKLGRIGRINHVMNKNYPDYGSLKICPDLMTSPYARCPGIKFTYTF